MIREANLHWRFEDTETNLILPWYTLPALEWLKKQDVSKWYVFEYGAGYSTIWWRANAFKVRSVDSVEYWAKAMSSWFISNDEEMYVQSGFGHKEQFDCIIIDGDDRLRCTDFCRDYIKPSGYLIFDNYGQEDFPTPEVIDALLEGWEKQVFKQPNHSSWSTAIFKKP